MNNSFDFSTNGKYKKISKELSLARFSLINAVITGRKAVPMDQATLLCGGGDIIDALLAQNIVGLDENGEIGYLYPVSAHATGHRVRLADGREFDTMCAIDSLGCSATFGMDAEIFSFCKDTGLPVSIVVENGVMTRVNPQGMYVSYYDSWTDGSFNF